MTSNTSEIAEYSRLFVLPIVPITYITMYIVPKRRPLKFFPKILTNHD